MAPVTAVKHIFVHALAAACLLTGSLGVPAIAQEDMIRVSMDHARIIKLDRQISKVIVGSSAWRRKQSAILKPHAQSPPSSKLGKVGAG